MPKSSRQGHCESDFGVEDAVPSRPRQLRKGR
jgi:hypothetical protein